MTGASYPPSVELALLYERTSARGTRYMTGLLGLGRVTLLPGEPAEDGTPTWRLLIAGRQPAGERGASAATDPPPARRRSHHPAHRHYQRQPERSAADSTPMPADSVDDLWPEDGR
ncbi:MAG: hypothetical protein ACREDL_06435 [Bradyrhizobium sp.]